MAKKPTKAANQPAKGAKVAKRRSAPVAVTPPAKAPEGRMVMRVDARGKKRMIREV